MNIKFNILSKNSIAFILLMLAIPLSLTYYAWQLTVENLHDVNQAEFEALAKESEKALVHRLDSYKQALLGGKGFFEGSQSVERDEWRSYVESIDILKNFPGINGIGAIDDVAPSEMRKFLQDVRADNYPQFAVHPKNGAKDNFIIRYIEPAELNSQAVGLNIAFEKNRYDAAVLARDTGAPAITKRVLLVQDAEKTPGFLLLLPTYKKKSPIFNVEQKRAAFAGWIYAPFVAKNFMQGLTESQGSLLHLQVYDETKENPDTLIFDSNADTKNAAAPAFIIRKEIEVMQQKWLLVWSSTPNFEHFEKNNEPMLILLSGLLFTGLFAVFLIVMIIRGSDEQKLSRNSYIIPVAAFLVAASAAFYLQRVIADKEFEFIASATQKEASPLKDAIVNNVQSRVLALGRMAERWGTRGGTPYSEWQEDAKKYVTDQPGLETVEWVDSTYHVRWAEPLKGNEMAIGLNVVFDEKRKEALHGAAEKEVPTITPPIDLVQGYKAFISYSPIKTRSKFAGFIVGIFGIEKLIASSIDQSYSGNFVLMLSSDGKVFYKSGEAPLPDENQWVSHEKVQIYDKSWLLTVYPTPQFIKDNRSFLPELIFAIGIVLASMVALIINFAQRSKEKSVLLAEKEKRISAVVDNTVDGIVTFDEVGAIESCNPACETIFGYSRQEMIGNNITMLMPEPYKSTAGYGKKKSSKASFVGVCREVGGVHKNGKSFAVDLTISEMQIEGRRLYSGIVRDVSERKQAEKMKDEFISTVSHELRTPLTSITGSLGLIKEGVMGDVSEEAMDLVQTAYSNSKQLTLLINDILDIDKIESGNMRFDMRLHKINPLLSISVEANKAYAEKYGVTLVLKELEKDGFVKVDESRFAQVMSNLISNAIKFSPKGEAVVVQVERIKQKIKVSVVDKGHGIEKSFRSKIFSKFTQADSSSSRSKEGTGLGLNITKTIIEAMGGKINFKTIMKKGTIFYVELPEITMINEVRNV